MKTIGLVIFSCFVINSTAYASPSASHDIPHRIITQHTKINLNQVDAAHLVHSFKGIGKKRAEAIIQYRKTHGAFHSIMELSKVRGFGPTFVHKHRAQLEAAYTL